LATPPGKHGGLIAYAGFSGAAAPAGTGQRGPISGFPAVGLWERDMRRATASG